MKILTAQQIRAADQFTIENEPIAPLDLMERAAQQCADWLLKKYADRHVVYVFCGPGNNGGDGLAIARILAENGYEVQCFTLALGNSSPLFIENQKRLPKPAQTIQKTEDFPLLENENAVLIDALFGSGLNRPLDGLSLNLVLYLNSLTIEKVAIDIPSGIFSEFNSTNVCVEAQNTLTFQQPKLAFLLPEKGNAVGQFHVLPIGLHPSFLNTVQTGYHFTTEEEIKTLLKPLKTFSHKGTQGHLLLIGGQKNGMGALILSGKAAFYTGLGKLTILTAQCGHAIIQTGLPEALLLESTGLDHLTGTVETKISHWAVGPSLGNASQTKTFLETLLQKAKQPLVLDADALNLLAQNAALQAHLPPLSILTPHPKEFERLVGPWKDDKEKLIKLKNFATSKNVVVVLKGAFSIVALPDGSFWFNSSGNPGMATAGSGDVLTGIIGSLLAQGYQPPEAAQIGVFVHGKAGDLAAQQLGQRALTASGIVDALPKAFQLLE